MITPFYFRASSVPLFGVYHKPETLADRDIAVVIAPPFGREYMRAHRTLRHLAVRLSGLGFHSLRFDYRGVGDSAGDAALAELDEWSLDLHAAIEEIQGRTGVDRVAIVGVRLGATLALTVSQQRRDIAALVLWQPILDGRRYVEELVEQAEAWRRVNRIDYGAPADLAETDIIGFSLGRRMAQSLSELSLNLDKRPAPRVLVMTEDEPSDSTRTLSNRFREQGTSVELRPLREASIWTDSEGMARALIPQEAIAAAVRWLANEV